MYITCLPTTCCGKICDASRGPSAIAEFLVVLGRFLGVLKNITAVLMWVMISEYDLRFGYEYKLFESLNPVCQTAGEN